MKTDGNSANSADIGMKALSVQKLDKHRDELRVIGLEEFHQKKVTICAKHQMRGRSQMWHQGRWSQDDSVAGWENSARLTVIQVATSIKPKLQLGSARVKEPERYTWSEWKELIEEQGLLLVSTDQAASSSSASATWKAPTGYIIKTRFGSVYHARDSCGKAAHVLSVEQKGLESGDGMAWLRKTHRMAWRAQGDRFLS